MNPRGSGPQYAPEPETKIAESPDLLAQVDTEDWLEERLQQHGCDIYAGGPYATRADRIAACILSNGMRTVLIGCGPDGKPEKYAECYERFHGKALPKLAPKNTVGGQHDARTTTASRVPSVDRALNAAAPNRAVAGKTTW